MFWTTLYDFSVIAKWDIKYCKIALLIRVIASGTNFTVLVTGTGCKWGVRGLHKVASAPYTSSFYSVYSNKFMIVTSKMKTKL